MKPKIMLLRFSRGEFEGEVVGRAMVDEITPRAKRRVEGRISVVEDGVGLEVRVRG
jgi:hypothetical protein